MPADARRIAARTTLSVSFFIWCRFQTALHPLRMALVKFWARVPWMLEAAVLLGLILDKYVEAAIIAFLLVFNAGLGFFQESRAQVTLAALKSRLALNASVRRDSTWKRVPAAELVQGDLVNLSMVLSRAHDRMGIGIQRR